MSKSERRNKRHAPEQIVAKLRDAAAIAIHITHVRRMASGWP